MLTGGKFSKLFSGGGIQKAIQNAFSGSDPKKIFSNWKNGFSNLFSGFRTQMQGAWSGVTNYMSSTWGSSLSRIKQSWSSFGNLFSSTMSSMPSKWHSLTQGIRTSLQSWKLG